MLLAVVLTLVVKASAEIYLPTREEAVRDAKVRQELLSDQTCRVSRRTTPASSTTWVGSRNGRTLRAGTLLKG